MGSLHVEERPQCPKAGKYNEARGHSLHDPFKFHFGGKRLRRNDSGAIIPNDTLERNDQEGEREAGNGVSISWASGLINSRHALDYDEDNVGSWSDSTSVPYLVVLCQAEPQADCYHHVRVVEGNNLLDRPTN